MSWPHTNREAPAGTLFSLVTPTYSEASNIGRLIREVDAALRGRPYEHIIVDDRSPDGTGDAVLALAEEFPVTLVSREGRRDLSRAVCLGFARARGSVLGVMDADLSHPPEVLPRLLDALDRSGDDIVVASRLVQGGGTEDWPSSRKISSYIGTLLAWPFTRVKDPLSGFFVLRRRVIEGVPLRPVGYKILLEILVRGRYAGVTEIPFVFRDRSAGKSKLGIAAEIDYLRQLARLAGYALLHPPALRGRHRARTGEP